MISTLAQGQQDNPDATDVRGHYRAQGNFAPGGAFVNAVAIKYRFPCAGASRFRIAVLTAASGGTLSSRFLYPDDSGTAYAASSRHPADVPVVAGTEAYIEVDPHFGEGILEVTFTPAGNGTFTYVDYAEV